MPKPYLRAGIAELGEAIIHGKAGHADVATKHANSAVIHLKEIKSLFTLGKEGFSSCRRTVGLNDAVLRTSPYGEVLIRGYYGFGAGVLTVLISRIFTSKRSFLPARGWLKSSMTTCSFTSMTRGLTI